MKETIISLVIIITIFVLDITTHKYTEMAMSDMNDKLSKVREDFSNNSDELEKHIKELNDEWDIYNEKLSFYIEHDELEKVETYLSGFNSYIETQDKDMGINDADKTEFILEHISNKYKFSLENIF